MRSFSLLLRLLAVTFLSFCATVVSSSSSSTNSSAAKLLSPFTPPNVFENTNLVRNVNLERSYSRETTNIVIKNIGREAESQYYYAFASDEITNVGGFEVKDKKNAKLGPFQVKLARYEQPMSYFIITFPEALKPSESITLSVSYALLSTTQPFPAVIEQLGQQTITYSFSAYLPSAYTSQKQKTKLKLPTGNPAEFTRSAEKNADGVADPVHQSNSLTYGPYHSIKPGSSKPVSVRYDFTQPLLHATRLERDIEVSHWGGNLATEERYWLTNRAAKLKNHFSRVQWQMSRYANPASVSSFELKVPLVGGALNPYFVDDIGNVSTSRFRPGRRESLLELKPRYPIFGGWNYSFKMGWDTDLKKFLRSAGSEKHVLKVPFMEGPRTEAGIEYEHVVVRVVLPEGAQ
jgi:oligosaccharyltransferase complex subunit alpha (ribophorin I)